MTFPLALELEVDIKPDGLCHASPRASPLGKLSCICEAAKLSALSAIIEVAEASSALPLLGGHGAKGIIFDMVCAKR